jgi:predicted ATPase
MKRWTLSARTGEVWLDAELYRRRGHVMLLESPHNQQSAEVSVLQAIDIARRQTARLFELRAAATLARMWAAQAKYTDASNLLAPICAWFVEGAETADLREARLLLSSL